MVFASSANHPINIFEALAMFFHHVDRVARKVVARMFRVTVIVRMTPKEPPAFFCSLFVHQHSLRAQKDPESSFHKAQAEIIIDIVNKEVLVKEAYIIKPSKLDQTPGGDDVVLLHRRTFARPRLNTRGEELGILVEWVGSNNSHILHTLPTEGHISLNKLVNHAGRSLAVVIQRQQPLKSFVPGPMHCLVECVCKAFISFI